MTTYRLNPSQRTLLGFALGASAAIAPDVDHIKHLHKLAQKITSATNDTLTLDENERQYLANVIDTNRGSIPGNTPWPELQSEFEQLATTLRTGTQEGARSAAGR